MSVGFNRFYKKLSLNRKSVGNWLIWSIKIWPKEILSRKSVFRQIYQSRFPVILIAFVLNSEYKTFSHIHVILRWPWWPILEAHPYIADFVTFAILNINEFRWIAPRWMKSTSRKNHVTITASPICYHFWLSCILNFGR